MNATIQAKRCGSLPFSLGFMLLAFGPGNAEPVAGPPPRAPLLTLEDALGRAQKVNLAGARARAQARIYDAEEKSATTWTNPVVHTGVGRKELENGSGPVFDISVEQRLPASGVRGLKVRLARERRSLAQVAASQTYVVARVDLIRLLFAYGAQASKNEHLRTRLERLSVVRAFLGSRPLTSPSRRVESYIIGGRLQALERELAKGEAELTSIWPRLNVHTQLETAHAPHMRWLTGGPRLELAELTKKAADMSPVLGRLRAEIREGEVNTALADASRYPAPALRAYFGADRSSTPENYYGIGIALSLPFSSRAGLEKRRALAVVSTRRLALRDEERRLNGQLGSSLARYNAAVRAVMAMPLSKHEEADRQLAYAHFEFRRGRVDASGVLEMDAQADEIHEAIFEAQLALVQAYTDLMLFTGDRNFALADWRMLDSEAKEHTHVKAP